MTKIYEALQAGDMVCLFPEGVSRYQSGLAPLKPGVGRIALEVSWGVSRVDRLVFSLGGCMIFLNVHNAYRVF